MEEQKDFVVWGDGAENSIYSQRKYKVIPDISKKKQIEKLYLHKDVALYVTNGELIKEGRFDFEKRLKSSSSEKTVVFFKMNKVLIQPLVSQISIGLNHVILMTLQGQVFTWGDNYYGQLGIGNPFHVMSLEPTFVNKIDSASFVMAYENTSFMISTTKKLWVWGSSKYIGSNLSGNLFKPFQTHSNLLYHKLKVNDGLFIAKTTLIQDNQNNQAKNLKANTNIDTKKKENDGNETGANDGYLLTSLKKVDKVIKELISKFNGNMSVVEEVRSYIIE